MTSAVQQQDSTYLRGTSIPVELLGQANTMDRLADSGFYYLYSPGLAVHRVQQQDGCPHIYPARAKCVNDFAKWYNDKMGLEIGSIANRTTRDITGKAQQETLAPDYAGAIVASILDGETGWGKKAVIKLDALSQRQPADIDIDYFNDLIAPYPIVYTRTDPNARFDDVDPRLKSKLADIPESIYEQVRNIGALEVRRQFVLEARKKLESGTLGISTFHRDLYLTAIREILPSFDLFRQWATAVLNAKDKVVSGSQGKVMYDELDGELQWNLARKAVDANVEQKAPVVNVQLPDGYGQQGQQVATQAADIARQPCATCGEMIAVTAKKCRYCNEAVAVAVEATPVGASSVTVTVSEGESFNKDDPMGESERQAKLKAKQDEARQRNQSRR